jgi:hypothetical protein
MMKIGIGASGIKLEMLVVFSIDYIPLNTKVIILIIYQNYKIFKTLN